jgi:hypothetical protein
MLQHQDAAARKGREGLLKSLREWEANAQLGGEGDNVGGSSSGSNDSFSDLDGPESSFE